MGLDSYIIAKIIPNEDEQIYNKLAGEEPKPMEILYWRKEWGVLEWFKDTLGVEIINCDEYELSEDILRALLRALESGELEYDEWHIENLTKDIKRLKLILKNTDFSKTKFIFYNWW